MASVFLSYDHDDAAKARPIALQLEKAGHDVWWDLHVRGGAQFSKVIEEALKAANAVVVLWSARSVESAWVRDEAAAGRDTGRLVPVTIDGTEPPLGFRQFQTIDLSRRSGRLRPASVKMLLDDVAAISNGSDAAAGPAPAPRVAAANERRWWPFPLAAVGIALAIVAVLAIWRPWSSANGVPTILVTAGRNDSASQEIASDLAVQLGGMGSVESGSLRLLTPSETHSQKPLLALEAASVGDAQASGAKLVLKNVVDGSVVWSQNFQQGERSAADVKRQMALTASRVLDCAADALADYSKPLPVPDRTSYVTSCAQASGVSDYDPKAVVLALSKVVADASHFASAWRKLLIAECDVIEFEADAQARAAEQQTLRKHIAAARKAEPRMPEAIVAEMYLVAPTDIAERMRLMDKAYEAAPHNTAVLIRRTRMLQNVGRMVEGQQMAFLAMQIDPDSPAVFNNFISAMMYSGELDLAEQQLKRAQRFWMGTATLDELEWRYYLRLGDPKIGLKMAEDRMMSPTLLLFAKARADPSKENVGKLIAYYEQRFKGDPVRLPAIDILMQAYGQFHRENELYEILLHWPNQASFDDLQEVWFRPSLHEFRRDPRFIQVVARSPLLRYWRSTGRWPDFCKEPDLPYDCKREAAKIGS